MLSIRQLIKDENAGDLELYWVTVRWHSAFDRNRHRKKKNTLQKPMHSPTLYKQYLLNKWLKDFFPQGVCSILTYLLLVGEDSYLCSTKDATYNNNTKLWRTQKSFPRENKYNKVASGK